MLTRFLDIFFSLIGCLLLLPMLPFIALFVKLDSRGPVFFKCDRVGKDGKIFKMYKFRTMYETSVPVGASVSPLGDPRITAVGRILRRLKVNEIPQLFNVLKGDMTLVGPRPEAPDLAAAYPPEAHRIFSVKPGLAGPNQILGRNEEELYPQGEDPKKYYIEHILPWKLPVDLQYIDDKSLFKDLKHIFLAVKVTLTGAVARRHLTDNLSQIFLLVSDLGLCAVSLTLAHLLRFEDFSYPLMNRVFLGLLPWAVLIRLPVFIYFNFYHTLIRHLSLYDIKRVFTGVALSSVAFVSTSFFLGLTHGYSRGVFLIDWFCLTTMLIAYRALLKKLYRYYRGKNIDNGQKKRVLIWGAGDCGELCLRYLQKKQNPSYEVVGFIDDDPRKKNQRLNGVKVLGNRHHLEILCQLYKVQEVYLSIHKALPAELARIVNICQGRGLTTRIFSEPDKAVMETSYQVSRAETS